MSGNIVNGEDRALNILVDYFQRTFNLGVGNDYDERILNQTMAKLAEEVRDAYPEYFELFEAERQKFMTLIKQKYSSSRGQQRSEEAHTESAPPVEEKKTDLKTTTTQSMARANA